MGGDHREPGSGGWAGVTLFVITALIVGYIVVTNMHPK